MQPPTPPPPVCDPLKPDLVLATELFSQTGPHDYAETGGGEDAAQDFGPDLTASLFLGLVALATAAAWAKLGDIRLDAFHGQFVGASEMVKLKLTPPVASPPPSPPEKLPPIRFYTSKAERRASTKAYAQTAATDIAAQHAAGGGSSVQLVTDDSGRGPGKGPGRSPGRVTLAAEPSKALKIVSGRTQAGSQAAGLTQSVSTPKKAKPRRDTMTRSQRFLGCAPEPRTLTLTPHPHCPHCTPPADSEHGQNFGELPHRHRSPISEKRGPGRRDELHLLLRLGVLTLP